MPKITHGANCKGFVYSWTHRTLPKYFCCSASPPKLHQFLKGKFPLHELIQHIWQVRNKVISEGVEPDLESLKIVLASFYL